MDLQWILIGLAVVLAWGAWRRMALVSAGAARELIRKGARVVDVREPGEFQSRHLQKSVNIPLDQLRQRIGAEFPGKETVLLLHCEGGVRSAMGKRILRQMGYSRVFNLGSYGRAQRILKV